jgi:hypothetical protein
MGLIGDKLSVWTKQEISIASSVIEYLEISEISVSDFKVFAKQLISESNVETEEENKIRELTAIYWNEHATRCIECNKKMTLSPVNTIPSNRVPGGYESVWTCIDEPGCGFQIWNKRSVHYHYKRIQTSFSNRFKNMTNEDLKNMTPIDLYNKYGRKQ